MGLLAILVASMILGLFILVFFFFGTDAALECWAFWTFISFIGLLLLNAKVGFFNYEQFFYGFNWIGNIGNSEFWKWLTTPL